MSERDVLIERLEKKLIEKEREISELRKMLSEKSSGEDLESLKQSLLSDLRRIVEVRDASESDLTKKVAELESKVVELRRAVESLMTEVVYIKNELREVIKSVEGDRKARRKEEIESRKAEIIERVEKEAKREAKPAKNDVRKREELLNSEDIIDGETYERVREDDGKFSRSGKETRNTIVGKLSDDWSRNGGKDQRNSKRVEFDDSDDDIIICG